MLEEIAVEEHIGLDAYAAEAHLAPAVTRLRADAARIVPSLRGRTVWMVNSTPQGGGVAEMLPKLVSLLRELGVACRWVVLGSNRADFFPLTKRIHNMIHGSDGRPLSAADRELFEDVNRANTDDLRPRLHPNDIVVVHDPQPLALGAWVRRESNVRAIFRSHIGVAENTPLVRAAWEFLKPYIDVYDRCAFTLPEYAPEWLAGRISTMLPSIDPWSHKNRDLAPQKLMGVLCNAGLAREVHPVLTPPFEDRVARFTDDVEAADDVGLLYRPIVTQVSRWDSLKGFEPLLRAFVILKQRARKNGHERHCRRLEILRLVLAGPDPSGVKDDPGAAEVLASLRAAWMALPNEVRDDIAILSLPMASRKENALIVNALQRCSSIVVQNSIREGFGLTATEAMWKRVPVLGTHASGLRAQIREGVDGILTKDPEDPEEIAYNLDVLLRDAHRRESMGSAGQRRVHAEFLVFSQVRAWLDLLAGCVA